MLPLRIARNAGNSVEGAFNCSRLGALILIQTLAIVALTYLG